MERDFIPSEMIITLAFPADSKGINEWIHNPCRRRVFSCLIKNRSALHQNPSRRSFWHMNGQPHPPPSPPPLFYIFIILIWYIIEYFCLMMEMQPLLTWTEEFVIITSTDESFVRPKQRFFWWRIEETWHHTVMPQPSLGPFFHYERIMMIRSFFSSWGDILFHWGKEGFMNEMKSRVMKLQFGVSPVTRWKQLVIPLEFNCFY